MTNAANDTAIFEINGTEYGRQYFTTEYLINSTDPHNTTRVYIRNATYLEEYTAGDVNARTFIIFDGFKYNQSTCLSFDP